jgi:hypothetical protein
MNFFTFSAMRDLSDKMARENGLDYTGVNGSRLTSQFYHDVRRGRVRHLIKVNDEEFGFVDFVTPFSGQILHIAGEPMVFGKVTQTVEVK